MAGLNLIGATYRLRGNQRSGERRLLRHHTHGCKQRFRQRQSQRGYGNDRVGMGRRLSLGEYYLLAKATFPSTAYVDRVLQSPGSC